MGKADWKGSRFLSQNACLGLRWECSFAPQVFNSSQRWIDEISFQPPISGPNSKRQGKANAVAFSSTVYTSFYGPWSDRLFGFTSRKNQVRWVLLLWFSNPSSLLLNEIAECKDSCTVKYIYGLHGLFHLFRINVFLKSSINPFCESLSIKFVGKVVLLIDIETSHVRAINNKTLFSDNSKRPAI